MLIRYGYDFTLSCPAPTTLIALVSARPEHAPKLEGAERHWSQPDLPVRLYRDEFGNICRSLTLPAGQTRLAGSGLLRCDGQPEPVRRDAMAHPVDDLPPAVLPFLRASRYCESDEMAPVAWGLFGHLAPGWDMVQAICDHVHGHIRFNYGDASASRTALQAWAEGRGVCRDFAHLAIAFCRAMNIPARYVNGYLGDIGVPAMPDPMDYAASIEVWLGGAWHAFDPRNNCRRIGRIAVAHGRDAADVAMLTSFGPHVLESFRVITEEVPPHLLTQSAA